VLRRVPTGQLLLADSSEHVSELYQQRILQTQEQRQRRRERRQQPPQVRTALARPRA
jgi:hypothetical protein